VADLLEQHVHCSNQFVDRLLSTADLQHLIEAIPALVCSELQADLAFIYPSMSSADGRVAMVYSVDPLIDLPQPPVDQIARMQPWNEPTIIDLHAEQADDLVIALGCRQLLVIPFASEIFVNAAVIIGWRTSLTAAYDHTHALLIGRYLGIAVTNAERHLEALQSHIQLLQQLRLSERLAGMSRLTAVIAHEVNNPLQAIVNALHLLARPLDPAKHTRYLEMATAEAERLTHLIQRALLVYQPTREGRRAVAIQPLIDRAIEQHTPQLRDRQITIERVAEPTTLHVIGVASHLREVVASLIQNAIEASSAGGRICVDARSETSGENPAELLVVIEVSDSGAGIPTNQLQEIFEPFFTTKPNHAGMSLPICYDIVSHHDGRLTVRSSSSGSSFRIELPLASATESRTAQDS
jgi:signal transduction histidine kinase